jgi:D-alanyl-D-alanine dipeptidase
MMQQKVRKNLLRTADGRSPVTLESIKPDFPAALRYAAASNALGGRLKEAQRAMTRLRQIDPTLRVSNLIGMTPLRRPRTASYEEGMRKAGLPE